jgi:hypothetical protein
VSVLEAVIRAINYVGMCDNSYLAISYVYLNSLSTALCQIDCVMSQKEHFCCSLVFVGCLGVDRVLSCITHANSHSVA